MMVIVVAVFLFRTRAGFRPAGRRSQPGRGAGGGHGCGPDAIDRDALERALCGLAGAVELSGVVGTLYENYAPGYGFTAVAVALLGRLNPFGIIASALFFGALTAGSGSMERAAGVSANLSYVLQAVTCWFCSAFNGFAGSGAGR